MLILATSALSLAAPGSGGPARRLPSNPDRLRYVFRPAGPTSDVPLAIAAADYDADGVDEQVRHVRAPDGSSYIDVSKLDEGRGFNVLSFYPLGWSSLCGISDVTGDGVPELVWYAQETGTRRARLTVSQVVVGTSGATRRDIGSVAWEYEEPAPSPEEWRSTAFLLDSFDLDGDGTRESLACLMSSGKSLRPRGVWLLDWTKGTIVWRCPTAGTPSGGHAVADIDGDGVPEMVVGLESPDNGVVAGPWRDDRGYVAAIELDGTVRWWQEIAGYSCEIPLAVGDADGDGCAEVVTGVGTHSMDDEASLRVAVWRGADGELVADLPFGVSVTGVVLAPCREGARIFTATSDGRLTRLRLEEGKLVVEDALDCREAVDVLVSAHIDPAAAQAALLAGLKSGSLVAVNERLRPLAFLPIDDASQRLVLGSVVPATFRVGERIVHGIHYASLTQHRRLYLARNPLPFWLRITIVAGGVLAIVGGVPWLRRGSLAVLRRALLPRASRDAALDELLTKLATASHGKLAATATFRRLREQLAMLSLYEGAPPEAFRQRFHEAVEDARDIGLPTVREIGHAAARLGLSVQAPSRLRRHLSRIASVVEALADDVAGGREAAKYQQIMDSVLPHVTEELEVVRRAAERERSAPATNELARAVRSRSAEIESAKIELTLEVAPELSDTRVVGTAQELSFVFENLLANAVRAMEGAPRRRLAVRAVRDGDLVVVAVGDTGKGIAPERQEELFRPGVSERSGGGHGLAGSRDILAKRGGTIRLARSAPGEGSVFEVRLKTVA